jgi:hypothetical protein
MPEELSLLKDMVEKESKEALAPVPSYAARPLYRQHRNTDATLL